MNLGKASIRVDTRVHLDEERVEVPGFSQLARRIRTSETRLALLASTMFRQDLEP